MYYRYFTSGSESEKEGLTTVKFSYYDDGQLAVGVENLKSIYKGKEISEEEYNEIQRKLNDPTTKVGFANGILNDEGAEKYRNWIAKMRGRILEMQEPKIALSVKKIKKMLELGIISPEDVDTEIAQQGMNEFKDEIKRRLEQK